MARAWVVWIGLLYMSSITPSTGLYYYLHCTFMGLRREAIYTL